MVKTMASRLSLSAYLPLLLAVLLLACVVAPVMASSPSANLVNFSENYTTTAWTKTGLTVTGNQFLGPSGDYEASRVNETSGSGGHLLYNGSAGTTYPSGIYTTTYLLKKSGTTNFVQILYSNGINATAFSNIDLGNCSVWFSSANTATAGWQPNGYCNVNDTVKWASATQGNYLMMINNTNNTRYPSYVGVVTDAVYLAGIQVEKATSATGYLKTNINPPKYYIDGNSVEGAMWTLPAENDLNNNGFDVYGYQMRNNHDPNATAAHSMYNGGQSGEIYDRLIVDYIPGTQYFIVNAGINDHYISGITTAQNIKKIYNYVQGNGSTAIVLIHTLANLSSSPADYANISVCEQNLSESGIPFIRMYDALDSIPWNNQLDQYNGTYIPDNNHPNQTGHRLMGEYLWQFEFTTPIPSFTKSKTSVAVGETFNVNETQNLIRNWSWGDGTPNATIGQNATHSYTTGGTKTITLEICNAAGCNQTQQTIDVGPPSSLTGITFNAIDCNSTKASWGLPDSANLGNITYWVNNTLQSPALSNTTTNITLTGLPVGETVTLSTKTCGLNGYCNASFMNNSVKTASSCDANTAPWWTRIFWWWFRLPQALITVA